MKEKNTLNHSSQHFVLCDVGTGTVCAVFLTDRGCFAPFLPQNVNAMTYITSVCCHDYHEVKGCALHLVLADDAAWTSRECGLE